MGRQVVKFEPQDFGASARQTLRLNFYAHFSSPLLLRTSRQTLHKLESIHSAPRARFAASNRDCQITSFGNSSYPRNYKINLATAKPYALVAAVPSSGSSCFRSSRISLSRCACRGISVLRSFVDDSIQLSRARYFGFTAIRAIGRDRNHMPLQCRGIHHKAYTTMDRRHHSPSSS